MKLAMFILILIIIYQAIKIFNLKTSVLDLEQENDLVYVGKFNEEQRDDH